MQYAMHAYYCWIHDVLLVIVPRPNAFAFLKENLNTYEKFHEKQMLTRCVTHIFLPIFTIKFVLRAQLNLNTFVSICWLNISSTLEFSLNFLVYATKWYVKKHFPTSKNQLYHTKHIFSRCDGINVVAISIIQFTNKNFPTFITKASLFLKERL